MTRALFAASDGKVASHERGQAHEEVNNRLNNRPPADQQVDHIQIFAGKPAEADKTPVKAANDHEEHRDKAGGFIFA